MSWRKDQRDQQREQRRAERGYHHGNLKEALLQAALDLIAQKGAAGFTFADAARMAGVSPAAPYRHFPDRESLLAALAAEGFDMLGRSQREAAQERGLRGMGEAYVAFALAHPQRFRLMFGGQVQVGRHAALREAATRTFEALAGALALRLPASQGARDASIAA